MKFKFFLILMVLIGTLVLSGCLGGKKLTENKSTPEPKVTAATKPSSPKRERKRPAIIPKSQKKQAPSTSSGTTAVVNTKEPKTSKAQPEIKPEPIVKKPQHKSKSISIRDGATTERSKESVKSLPDSDRKTKAAFESKSMCALEPVDDWYYSFAENAAKTFTKCKSYPPEANYIRYLDKQTIYEVGELNRKIVTKNTKGVMSYAVRTGEVVSQICFNQEGEVVAAKVLECSSNYDYARLIGFQEALLGYKWSENKAAAPIECMKHFFSTALN